MIAAALLTLVPAASAVNEVESAPATATIDDPGGPLTGTIELRGTATAREGFELAMVRIVIDDVTHGIARGTDAWTYDLDTTTLVDGPHRILALALAKPDDGSDLVLVGTSAAVDVLTANDADALVLFDQSVTFVGWQPIHWTYRLPQEVTGLRLLLAGDETARGTASLAYTDHLDEGFAVGSTRVVAGIALAPTVVTGPATIAVNPDAALHEAGLLTLEGHFVGEGTLRLRVEAVATPDE